MKPLIFLLSVPSSRNMGRRGRISTRSRCKCSKKKKACDSKNGLKMKEKEMLGGCCVCSDERGWPDNPLVYCDGNGCTVAVHQACYGIVTVPTGPWYCRKCESPEFKGKVRCELCPSKSGALKRSDTGGWAHVVCALYIPEVRFGNVTSMEPIVLHLIPPERYNKICYICQEMGKNHRATAGACMQCNKAGCKQQFHVTCAQSLGLLCEEAGNYLDNVKYCGYCQHHYSKLKKGGNVKTIPPYKPVSHDSHSSDSSGEKDGDASPAAGAGAGAGGTPAHKGNTKGAGRKSSHSSSSNAGKNTPNSSKSSSNHTIMSKNHHGNEKSKKPSPSRRGSSAGEASHSGSGSKSNTPAPSPQHLTAANDTNMHSQSKGSGGSTPKNTSAASPGQSSKHQEPVGVISSVSTIKTTSASPPPTSSGSGTSVVQAANLTKPSTAFQESVITNAESIENKQTKKRKAVNAANAVSAAVDYLPPPSVNMNDSNYQSTGGSWENNNVNSDVTMENVDKIIKKAKTEPTEAPGSNVYSIPLPPPLPPYSPPSQPSPRLHASVIPGPSGMNNASHIRSPLQQGSKGIDRESATSLLVSVPLPSTSQGLNLSAHSQLYGTYSESGGPSPHIFRHVSESTATEQSAAGHPGHGRSAWGSLNASYEPQQHDKSSYSATPSTSKEPVPSTSGTSGRKKRSPMTPSVVAMANPSTSTIQTVASTSYASARHHSQPTPPPPLPMYHETIKDSPPASPGTERAHKGKMDNNNKIGTNCSAPHMLGNELNPESGAAARLQQQLNAELAVHAQGAAGPSTLVPPPLINKATPGPSGSSSRSSSCGAQSLDQLLERQWEQGSQFLMEQAQHFDIASLLSCLHQLRTENVRLEDHVSSLLQRRDHLLAVNARLAIPLTTVTAGPAEPPRCPRDNGPQVRGPPVPVRSDAMPTDRHQLMMRDVQQKPS